jgi:antirestriction protein ArdC
MLDIAQIITDRIISELEKGATPMGQAMAHPQGHARGRYAL